MLLSSYYYFTFLNHNRDLKLNRGYRPLIWIYQVDMNSIPEAILLDPESIMYGLRWVKVLYSILLVSICPLLLLAFVCCFAYHSDFVSNAVNICFGKHI